MECTLHNPLLEELGQFLRFIGSQYEQKVVQNVERNLLGQLLSKSYHPQGGRGLLVDSSRGTFFDMKPINSKSPFQNTLALIFVLFPLHPTAYKLMAPLWLNNIKSIFRLLESEFSIQLYVDSYIIANFMKKNGKLFLCTIHCQCTRYLQYIESGSSTPYRSVSTKRQIFCNTLSTLLVRLCDRKFPRVLINDFNKVSK